MSLRATNINNPILLNAANTCYRQFNKSLLVFAQQSPLVWQPGEKELKNKIFGNTAIKEKIIPMAFARFEAEVGKTHEKKLEKMKLALFLYEELIRAVHEQNKTEKWFVEKEDDKVTIAVISYLVKVGVTAAQLQAGLEIKPPENDREREIIKDAESLQADLKSLQVTTPA